MRSSPIAFIGSNGQSPVSFAGSFPVSYGVTESPIGSIGLSDIVDVDAAANEVLESAINGAAVGITAFAAEAGHTVDYTLSVNPGGLFAIGLSTGVVTKAAALDAETAVGHDITVRATSSSGKIKERVFSIAVNDADEFNVGPVTDVNGAANEVSESAPNGTPVGITAQAADADVTDTVTYSLFNDAGGRFAIDESTGVVTVADTGLIDFETQTSHEITVRATSSDLSTQDQNFTITVLNDLSDDGLVPATRFEGTSTVLRRAANPTGAADGVNGTFAIPIKMMGAADPFDTKLQYIWSNETGSYVRRNADGKVEAVFADAAGVPFVTILSTNTLRVASGWTMLLVNPDKMYFGNTDETGTRTPGAGATIDWTSGFNWGEDSAGGNRGNFELARPWLALEAYDLTLLANREKFFTAPSPLSLADIKTDGSGPTGTQALDFLPNAYTAFSQNAGSGGNYSTVGTPREGAGPDGAALTAPASYAANAVTVERNVDRLDSSANFAADGETVSMSVWLRRNGALGSQQWIFAGQAARWTVNFTSANLFEFQFWDGSAATNLTLRSSAITDTDWHHFAVSMDNNLAGAAVTHLYVDGVPDKTVANDTIIQNFNLDRSYSIANSEGGASLGFDGDIAELWISSEFVDFSVLATLERFRSAAGKPVDLGVDGSTPTGTAPEIYMKDSATTVGVNSGSDPNFTVVGTFTNAMTSPTDTFAAVRARSAQSVETGDVFTFPTGTKEGDLIVVILGTQGTTLPTQPAGWVNKAQDSGFNAIGTVYAKVMDADDITAGQVTIVGSGRQSAVLYRIATHNGVDGVEASAVAAALGAGAAATDPPILTPTWGSKKTRWLAASVIEEGLRSVLSYPTNYTDGLFATGNSTSVSRFSAASADRKLEAASEDPGALTWSNSAGDGDHVAITVAIEPAP